MEIMAPEPLIKSYDGTSIFLSGSIEMGDAPNWQETLAKRLDDFIILNPRRDDWDSSWVQSIDNDQFREQVEWEIKAMEAADIIVVNFCAGYKAPITLLEFGLFASRGKENRMVVHCPDGFWRKGNVDIVCSWYGIQQVNTMDELVNWILQYEKYKAPIILCNSLEISGTAGF